MQQFDPILPAIRIDASRDGGFPPGPRLPALAQGAMFVLRIVPFFERCRSKYGSTFSLRLPTQPPIVVFSDEASIQEIFSVRPDDINVGAAYDWMQPFVGRSSVLLMDGERHLRERRLLMPPFHQSRMQAYGAAIRGIAERAMEGWRVGHPFEVEPEARSITLDIILQTVFGVCGYELDELRRAILDLLSDFSVFNLISALRVDLGRLTPWGRFLAHRSALDSILFRLIRERRTGARAGGSGGRDDVLAMLIDARYDDGSAMRDQELRDELVTMVGAGHETSTSALAWVFQRLAHHPEAQSRAHAELERTPHDGELPWLDAVIKETLRLHTVFPLLGRVLKRAQTIGGFEVREGTLVYVSIDLAHRNPDIWPMANDFVPERFLDLRPRPFTYFPFGGGTRRCIGMSYALYEMRLIVAEALRRFRIVPRGAPEAATTRGFTLAPAKGAVVRLVPR